VWTGRRPSTISAASGLLYSSAALYLFSAGIILTSVGSVADAISTIDPADQSLRNTVLVTQILSGSLTASFGITSGVLGVLIGKGKNSARIVTWVFSIVQVLCYGCSLAGSLSLFGSSGASVDPDLQRRLDAAVPAWQDAAGTGVTLILVVAMFAVIILLTLPSSNRYFRRGMST
jgi:hypothetical protein